MISKERSDMPTLPADKMSIRVLSPVPMSLHNPCHLILTDAKADLSAHTGCGMSFLSKMSFLRSLRIQEMRPSQPVLPTSNLHLDRRDVLYRNTSLGKEQQYRKMPVRLLRRGR